MTKKIAFAVFASSLFFACGPSSSGENDDPDASAADAGWMVSDASEPDAASPEYDASLEDAAISDASSPEDDAGEDAGMEDGGNGDAGTPGRSCAAAEALEGSEGGIDLLWSASDPRGRYAGTCGGSEGSEYVFSFTVSERTLFDMRLDGEPDGVLYLRKDNCADSSPEAEVACGDSVFGDVIRGEVPAGTHYVFADAFNRGASGPARLEWSLSRHPCVGFQCAENASCVADEKNQPQCSCPEGQVYAGLTLGCVANPCLNNPCAGDKSTECGWTDESLPGHVCRPRQWTVMAFMSGDSNLHNVVGLNLEQMEKAAQAVPPGSGASRIILVADGYRQNDTIVLTMGLGEKELTKLEGNETFLGEMTELDMSDGKSLRDFGVWAIGRYPAEHYLMVLWDHGSGWKTMPRPPSRGFSIDMGSNPDDPGSEEIFISTGEYGEALNDIVAAAGRRLDLLAFDACLMSMYEVALATAPYANYFLASEELVPMEGCNYETLLKGLFADETAPVTEWAAPFPAAYVATDEWFYTMALTDLSKMGALTEALDELGQALIQEMSSEPGRARIADARSKTLAFDTPEHRDLGAFVSRLAADEGNSTAVREAAGKVSQRIGEAVLETKSRGRYLSATGLAIYLPELLPQDQEDCPDESYFLTSAPWHDGGWETFVRTLRCEAAPE